MFFPERIKSIKKTDRVLEVGPGGTPYHRSDVLLEYQFDRTEAEAQRGYAAPLKTSKPVVWYQGDRFPFKDKEFDYVICSHVIEHVPDVNVFVAELNRVAKGGYLEYPTIYYDYIYNFPEHRCLVKLKNETLYWMKKSDSRLKEFQPIQSLFYESLRKEYFDLVNDLKLFFFEGFEWHKPLGSASTSNLSDLVFEKIEMPFKPKQPVVKQLKQLLKSLK